MTNKPENASRLSRRNFLKTSTVAAGALAMPMIATSRKSDAAPIEINMLGWYGTAEPDMVADFEAANNVKFVPKYYAGGDNMLAALAQNPPGTFDLIHTDAEYAALLIESELVDELDPSDYPMDDLMRGLCEFFRSLERQQALFTHHPLRPSWRILQQGRGNSGRSHDL